MCEMSPTHFFMEKELNQNEFCSAMAGVKLLHYVDVKNVDSQTPNGDGWTVVLKNGHYWRRIHFSTAKVGCNEEGDAYRHTLEVALPGKGAVAVRDIMTLERGRYLVRVTDNNGVKWLMGDTETPMRMKVSDNNDGTPDGTTAYNLTITGLTQWPQMKVV